MREMFSALDKDKNGYIDRDELKTSFAGLSIQLSDSDVADMMAEAEVYADRIYFEGSSASRLLSDNTSCHKKNRRKFIHVVEIFRRRIFNTATLFSHVAPSVELIIQM